MDSTWANDLGEAQRRDPDALPPSNYFEFSMYLFYRLLKAFSGGNVLFAFKAAILTSSFLRALFYTVQTC